MVKDNTTDIISKVCLFQEMYHTHIIRISPFNSKAAGPIERQHKDVRKAIMKTTESSITHWSDVMDVVFWAKWVTIWKATGMSPYYIVHGVEPILPFDLAEATYMSPELGDRVAGY